MLNVLSRAIMMGTPLLLGALAEVYAERAGMMITAIEGTAVETQEDLDAVKNQFKAGDTINLTVFRDGDFYSVDVVLMDAAG